MMKTLQNKKLFQRVEMENIRKKFHQVIYWIEKKKQSYGFSSKPNCFSNYKNVCNVI